MEQILKHKWLLLIGLVVGALFGTFSATMPTAYADYAGDIAKCTFAYSSDGASIDRTNCGGNGNVTYSKSGGGVYTYKTPAAGAQKITCSATITVALEGSSTAGNIGGKHLTSSSAGKAGTSYSCANIATKKITIKKSTTTTADSSNSVATQVVEAQLNSLVSSACGGDARCISAQQQAIGTCTDSTLKQITDTDAFKDKKFKDLFSACLTAAAPSLGDAATISGALSDTIYSDIQSGIAESTSADGQLPSDGQDSIANCSSTNPTTGWFICPIVEGLAKSADAIYENMIQPLLVTKPLVLDAGDPVFQAWSDFRIIGDILLVIGLLVVVFGQSIGGGVIDAYTAKKVLPRLLIAAVGINLSIYLMAAAVDITNILGNGIIGLMEAPFKSSGTFHLTLNGGAGTLGIAAVISAAFYASISLGPLLSWLWIFILVPLFLTFIAILATVIIRRGAIIFLVLISPVAFALYCLPNTEQYFRKWWDITLKTLLVYPIIAAIFATANILSITISLSNASASNTTKTLSSIISIIALVAPLFLIPFSFRLAGGVIGRLHDAVTDGRKKMHEAYKGNPNDVNSRQNKARAGLADRNIRSRERGVNAISGLSKTEGTSKRARAARALGSRYSPVGMAGALLNSGDLEYLRSDLNRRQNEKRETKTGFGPDSSVRALFAEKDKDGIWRSTTNGAAFSDIEVAKAHQLHGKGGGMSATQAALNYELGKAGNDDEYEKFMTHAPVMMEAMGYNPNEIGGIMKGVGFGAAAKRLEAKHTSFKKNKDTGEWTRDVNHAAFTQDAAENFGSYPMSNFKTSAIKQLGTSYDEAVSFQNESADVGDNMEAATALMKKHGFGSTVGKVATAEEFTKARTLAGRTVDDVRLSAQTLDTRLRRGESVPDDNQVVGEAEGGVPIAGGGTGAAGRVNKEIGDLIKHVLPPQQTAQDGSSGGQRGPRQGGGPGPTVISGGPGGGLR